MGYIGGGNALLFLNDQEKAKDLAKEWSKELLINTPGLNPNIAICAIDDGYLNNKDKFPDIITKIFKQLTENKLKYQPQTTLPRHGITAECNRTGLSAECLDKTMKDKKVYISSVARAKLAVADAATDKLHEDFKKVLKQIYKFPKEFEELGQCDDDSHIAIVHIDGNSMGSAFKSCKTLREIRNLSKSVKNSTKKSVEELLGIIIEKIETDDYIYDYFDFNWHLLPIRPIIIGGDDITFVCPGKLGIYFAKIFMEKFAEKEGTKGDEKIQLSSCAGVAITKTKYPFYRGYELAEDLCKNAKKESRKKKEENSSWLDFHLAYGGLSGELDDIRRANYEVTTGYLCLRPYRVVGNENDYRNFSKCIKGIKHFKGMDDGAEAEKPEQKGWPNSKIKELREVLTMGSNSAKIFIQEMSYRGRTLPEIEGYPECKDTGWLCENKKQFTPYFDMLELMEIYPIKLEEKEVSDVQL
ncbi:Cas10/Cmr2 second palm domain-containing protein [Methanosarcina horonobensis]|uniref:Cas10/Cmr2 second palm domain-containing protein n=1 Tax=Methanosarcina horonobensis TaxID=418008 RepID=UPI0013012C4A|nr:hypothetical protein [Methanosarcina horonobensis]